ncbi:MAG: hypothetical protein JXA52_06095, partial [Planctomycetes bacterium]|nr:hypothetical protein [Planctomycetota bacterium]
MSGKYPHYRCGISCLLLLFAALLLPGGNLQANTVIIGGDAVVTPPGPDPSFDVNGGSTVEVQEGAFVEAVGDDNGIQTGAGYTVTNSGSISGDNNNGGAVIDTGNGLFIDGNGTVTNNLNGIITGTTVSGPSSAGNGLRLVGIGIINNSGQITGACDFGINTHNGNGIYVTNGLTLTNQSNSIISGDTGLALAGGTASANGIYISNASMNSTITNYGSITGRVADSAASLQGNGMVLLSGAFVDGTILNYGIIEGSRT